MIFKKEVKVIDTINGHFIYQPVENKYLKSLKESKYNHIPIEYTTPINIPNTAFKSTSANMLKLT